MDEENPDDRSAGSPQGHVHRKAIAVAILVGAILLVPLPQPPEGAGFSFALPVDKVVHFLLFFFAGRSWHRSLAAYSTHPRLWTLGCASAYGGLIELLQERLSHGRVADGYDLIAGVLGTAVGLLARR